LNGFPVSVGIVMATATLEMAQAVPAAQQAAIIACMAVVSVSVTTAAAGALH